MTSLNDSHIYQEIHQQPTALELLLSSQRENARALAAEMNKRDIDHIVIAARGTSDNAGRYAKYLFGALNGLTVALATPSLFSIYERPPKFGKALVLGISQSGKSPDIVGVLAEARRQGALTAAVTNSANSDLAAEADHVIDICAGEERSVAATKTYTAELMAIALLAVAMAEDDELKNQLFLVPPAVEATLNLNERLDGGGRSMNSSMNMGLADGNVAGRNIEQKAQRYRYMRDCVVIGRGYNYSTAFELALKLKELTYTIADPYSSADFLHGPVALVENGFPVIVIAPSGVMLREMHAFLQTLRATGAEIIIVSDDLKTLELGHIQMPLAPHVPEWLSPITAIVPGQLFSMHLSYARHYDPDQPRGLNKVTETR